MVDVIAKAVIIEKIEDREYSFQCSNNADLGEAYTAWGRIGNYLVDRIVEAQKARQPQEAPKEEAPKEV